MVDTPNEYDNKPNRTRRAIYVFGFSIGFAVAAFYVTMNSESEIAQTFVKGAIGLIELIAISYLVTTTVDRSEILSKLGTSMRREDQNGRQYGSNNYNNNNQFSSNYNNNNQLSQNFNRQPYNEDMSDRDGAMG